MRLLQLKSRASLWVSSLYHKFWKLSIHPPWRYEKYIHGREKSKKNAKSLRCPDLSQIGYGQSCSVAFSKADTYCGSAHGSLTLMGNYDRNSDDEKKMNLIPKMIKMTVIRKRSPPNHSEMIIIFVILKWYNDRHFKKPFRFIFDLWRIYPFIFKWCRNLVFGMIGEPSFRNDRGNIRLWLSCSLISEAGGIYLLSSRKRTSFSLS